MDSHLLDLLALLADGTPLRGADLAARLGTSERTVRRDIARLRDRGYRIDSAPGVGGGYVAPRGMVLPPLQLSQDEAFTLALAVRTVTGQGVREEPAPDTGPPEHGAPVHTALLKLRSILPPTTARALVEAEGAIVAAPGNEPAVPLATIAALASAVAARVLVDLDHRSDRDGGRSAGDRRVEPTRLVVLGAHWYLLAWDLGRADWRTFRLDRIAGVRTTTFGFRERPGPDPVEYVREQVTRRVYPCRARVRVHAAAAEVSALIPARAGTVVAGGERTCEVELGAHGMDLIATHLLTLPFAFEVIEPAELEEEFAQIRRRVDGSGLVGPRQDPSAIP
ncbi:helix-turn-helix transcriptional regulator [Brevibacterium ihuae]|uniref:helix-turn-helix transcriptional regulator n=1 Tax=Brevibacterium ihuae TaxID=1631743 RepID=UPI000C782190|nr:WYL domain-containing protein [Brevibacterium ihuae]